VAILVLEPNSNKLLFIEVNHYLRAMIKNQLIRGVKIHFLKRYKIYLFLATIVLIFLLLRSTFHQQNNQTPITYSPLTPSLKAGHGLGDKNRSWTEQEAQAYATNFELVQQSIEAARFENSRIASAFADVSLLGTWKNRGPYNMPGAFEFCEVDEGTDTVYAVTCGHYGGVQFIWKGLLAGDNWTLVNPKNPSRFEDLIVIPNGGSRRVIAVHENGKIMFTDNSGATWTNSTGIPSVVKSTIVNRQDNNVLYTTDGKIVYRSTDNGTSFTNFYTLGTASINQARLYSPRWNNQPNSIDVYLAVDNNFFKINATKTSFDLISSSLPTGGKIGIGGDSRKLWLTIDRKWYYSTNLGTSFTYQLTKDWYYATESNDLHPQYRPGVNPEDPNVFIGGDTFPISTRDGGVTQNNDAKEYWSYYQNSVGNDPKMRINYHPDIQGSQFFYDKVGKLYALRSTDGGVFKSYNEWTKASFPDLASIQNGVFYNISLFDQPSQETYRGGFIYGNQNSSHLTTGTQDQGWQNTRNATATNNMYSWDQVGGGDGPCCITGDGKIGWRYNYFGNKEFTRIQLYNGSTYNGLSGTASTSTDFTFTGGSYFTPSVGDWSDGNRIWVLSQTLRKIEYNTSNSQITAVEKNLNGTSNYIQGIAQSGVNASLIYAMQGGTVFKSTDRGTNWTQIANQTATGMSAASENRGMGWSSPIDQNVVLFASESGTAVKTVFSKNGGTTWINVTGSGANLFPSAEVNGMAGTIDGKLVFASTNMGPYVFIVNEEKWYPLAIDPKVPVFWGQIVYCVKYGAQEIVRFSTWGQGVWDFEISSTTIAIAEQNAEDINVAIYPNPATEIIHISFSEKLVSNASLSICDELGKVVRNQKTKGGTETIDISNLKPGIYFVSIINGEERVRKKIIKK
jgi:hypothetical protein